MRSLLPAAATLLALAAFMSFQSRTASVAVWVNGVRVRRCS